jgi:hypothetical protein
MFKRLAAALSLAAVLLVASVPAASAFDIDPLKADAFAFIFPEDTGIAGLALIRTFRASRNAQIEMEIEGLEPGGRYYWDIRNGWCEEGSAQAPFGNPGTNRFLLADKDGTAHINMMLPRGSNAIINGEYSIHIYPKGQRPATGTSTNCGPILTEDDV